MFTDNSLYSLKYSQSLSIPDFTYQTASDLNSEYLKVKISSNAVKPTWTYGGYAVQCLQSGSEVIVVSRNFNLALNEPTLLKVERVPNYFLKLFLPKWFITASMSVFEYTGDTTNPNDVTILTI